MHPNLTRRRLSLLLPATAILPACSFTDVLRADETASTRLVELEQDSGGRLGVCAYDPLSGRMVGHRLHERFGMCSTFKLALAGLVLREIDAGRLRYDEVLPYTTDDLVSHAPITTRYIKAGGMTVGALAKAAQMTSDNVASNLLVRRLGGPLRFTQLLRELGDTETRLDRYEPLMNLVPEGEHRDTTTPAAMARTASLFLTGSVLSDSGRALLTEWLVDTRTGMQRLRAGVPADWISGNKTGTGIADTMPNKTNDILVAWPSRRTLLIVTAYYEADAAYPEFRPADELVLAEVGRIASAWYLTFS
jgi:beta-lactamase class A